MSEMKAKHFKRLRKRISTYKVRETVGLFGDFFGQNRTRLIMDDIEIMASSYVRAVKIYMRRYRKKWNKKNKHERHTYNETTEQWGRIMVTHEDGFMRFFR